MVLRQLVGITDVYILQLGPSGFGLDELVQFFQGLILIAPRMSGRTFHPDTISDIVAGS
jgi:hypothetical protein